MSTEAVECDGDTSLCDALGGQLLRHATILVLEVISKMSTNEQSASVSHSQTVCEKDTTLVKPPPMEDTTPVELDSKTERNPVKMDDTQDTVSGEVKAMDSTNNTEELKIDSQEIADYIPTVCNVCQPQLRKHMR